MGEKNEDQMDIDTSEVIFDNLTIMKELSNINSLVRDEDFLETAPKAKIKRVKWVPVFTCLKQGILNEMVAELNSMWRDESIPEKLQILEKQKEKYAEINSDNTALWRPQLADVKAQLKAHDVAQLQKQKKMLESIAKEYEARVNRLKKTVSAKRGYLRALQLDMQKHEKKAEEVITTINSKLENHSQHIKMVTPTRIDTEEINWFENDLKVREIDNDKII